MDWFSILNRMDLIHDKIKIVREEGFVPVTITHFPSISLKKADELDVICHWVLVSLDRMLLFEKDFMDTLNNIKKPITAFRVLGFGRHVNKIDNALDFVINKVNPTSIVLGINSKEELKKSFKILKEKMKPGSNIV